MNKKAKTVIAVLVVLAAGFLLWYNLPIKLLDLEPQNGNTGKLTHITDEEEIEHIIENLNDVKIKRYKPSVGYSGYSFKMTIYLTDGNEADGWNNFIINSEDTIRKDPFFYRVTEGNIDYEYIESITE